MVVVDEAVSPGGRGRAGAATGIVNGVGSRVGPSANRGREGFTVHLGRLAWDRRGRHGHAMRRGGIGLRVLLGCVGHHVNRMKSIHIRRRHLA